MTALSGSMFGLGVVVLLAGVFLLTGGQAAMAQVGEAHNSSDAHGPAYAACREVTVLLHVTSPPGRMELRRHSRRHGLPSHGMVSLAGQQPATASSTCRSPSAHPAASPKGA